LVDQRTDPDDNRKRLFSLTKDGADIVGKVWPEIRSYTKDMRALYTDEEFAQLKSLLQRALDRADALLEESDPASQNAA
jgi:DNA-binding MarR family transcriptional regulator